MFLSLHLPPHSGKQPSGMGAGLLQVVGPAWGETCRLEWCGEVVPRTGRIIKDQVMELGAEEQGRASRWLATMPGRIPFRPSTMQTQMLLAKSVFQWLFSPRPVGWSPNIKHANLEEDMHSECRVQDPKVYQTVREEMQLDPSCSVGQSHRSSSSELWFCYTPTSLESINLSWCELSRSVAIYPECIAFAWRPSCHN